MEYSISKQFTKIPGGRYITDGNFSGEEFRDTVLVRLIEEAMEKDEVVTINLDGTYGYPSSFLEESFGGLARIYGKNKVSKYFSIISNDDPLQIERIKNYVEHANEKDF